MLNWSIIFTSSDVTILVSYRCLVIDERDSGSLHGVIGYHSNSTTYLKALNLVLRAKIMSFKTKH